MDATGDFVVVWEDYDSLEIWGQRYSALGDIQGGPFVVGVGDAPAVRMDPAGNFVAVWIGSGFRGLGRRFDASGVADGNEFEVSTSTARLFTAPALAIDAAGDFFATWAPYDDDDPVFSKGIRARPFAVPNNPPEIDLNGADAGADFSATWLRGRPVGV